MTNLEGTARYLFETGLLKRYRRTGWYIAGVEDPESIAEHSWRTSIIGMVIASMEGADPARTSMLCTLHDTPETRILDIPHVSRRYLTATPAEDIAADQLAECPSQVARTIQDAIDEFEAQETPEAICARDADKLECLVQAVEYQRAGHDTVDDWIESSRAALKTASAKALAEDVLKGDTLGWQQTRRG